VTLYLIRRLIMSLVVIVLVMTFLGLLVHLIPGDPVKTIMGPRASPALAALVRKQMELDKPVPTQVYDFIRNGMEGNLGVDFVSQVPVTTLIRAALPQTIILAMTALVIAVLSGVPLGVLASTRPGSWVDRITGIVSVALITVPPYVAGLLLLVIVSVRLQALPAIGIGNTGDPIDYARHLLLPAVALALGWVGYIARLVRASMLEVLGSNYIRTARAFGLGQRLIFYKYGLRNAIIPTIAVLGVGLGNLIGGTIFVEVIFARPGLGTLIFNAIEARNYPIVRGGVLVIAIMCVLANLIADLSYRLFDPRIRVEGGGQ
jgi:peptide/nickel transport system permease protein